MINLFNFGINKILTLAIQLTSHHLKPLWSKRSIHQSAQVEISLNPLMPVNNVFNFDAYPWLKNTILIAGDSKINGIKGKRISTNFKSAKFRCFCGATINSMHFNLIPLLRKKPASLVLHVPTNNSSNETSDFRFTMNY